MLMREVMNDIIEAIHPLPVTILPEFIEQEFFTGQWLRGEIGNVLGKDTVGMTKDCDLMFFGEFLGELVNQTLNANVSACGGYGLAKWGNY